MTKERPIDWREARRYRAWELKQSGWKQNQIARALGVTPGAVSQWFKKVDQEGVDALKHHKGGGPKPRLNAAQLGQLVDILEQGAEAYGFTEDGWTRPRIAAVIEQEFSVSYTPQHVGNLLRKIGWSYPQTVMGNHSRENGENP